MSHAYCPKKSLFLRVKRQAHTDSPFTKRIRTSSQRRPEAFSSATWAKFSTSSCSSEPCGSWSWGTGREVEVSTYTAAERSASSEWVWTEPARGVMDTVGAVVTRVSGVSAPTKDEAMSKTDFCWKRREACRGRDTSSESTENETCVVATTLVRLWVSSWKEACTTGEGTSFTRFASTAASSSRDRLLSSKFSP